MSDTALAIYGAINLDGEYADFAQGYKEAAQIRSFVNAYNGRHPATPLKFIGYYRQNMMDAYPNIVSYPDIVMFGHSRWQGKTIIQKAKPYVDLIRRYGKIPTVLLGNYYKDQTTDQTVYLTANDVTANFHKVIDPPPEGLGLTL